MKRQLVIATILLFSSLSMSQIKIHRNLRVEDGLLQSTVRSICQDSKGYLWFGTESGISRWDGLNFVNYQVADGLLAYSILSLTELPDSSIIALTRFGINHFKDDKFTHTMTNSDKIMLNDLAVLDNGQVWITSSEGIYTFKNEKLTKINLHEDLDNVDLGRILDLRNGNILVASKDNRMYVINNGVLKKTFSLKNILKDETISAMEVTQSGRVYIGNYMGLFTSTNEDLENVKQVQRGKLSKISSIVEGNDGTIYIGSFGDGLKLLNGDDIEKIESKHGLKDDRVLGLNKGIDGTIYIGTGASGVYLYRNRQFITYNESVGLHNNFIMSITGDDYGNMYFGSMNNGFSILENGKFRRIDLDKELYLNSVIHMEKSRSGIVYIHGKDDIIAYNPDQPNKLNYLGFNKRYGVRPRVFYENEQGELLIGSIEGLALYKDGKFVNLKNTPRRFKHSIVAITQSKDGILYLGTSWNGLAYFKDGEYHWINEESGLINNSVMSLYESKIGEIYVGTNQGLSIISGDKIKNLNTKNGLSDNTVYGIIEDDFGKIYITTNRGINVLDYGNKNAKIRVIRAVDGLASDELNGQACWKDNEGRLWFGTVKGVTCYDPSKDIPHTIPPKIHLTRVRLLENDVEVNTAGLHDFNYDENYFRFDFIGINISSPQSVVYKYRMSGLDDDWLTTKQNSVQYTNLNDGDYAFEVMAMNEWGHWSRPTSFTFSINPPFWETAWFIIISSFALIGIIVYIVTYRFRQILAVERLRIKIAADLHDNIGASLTEISILGEVIGKNIKEENTIVSNGLEKISETSRTLVDKMSDIVWLVNPKRDSLYDLLTRLKDSYSELLSYKGISFKANNLKALENISLNMEHRQNLYLIFKEGINNSIKHSGCNEINIEAKVKGKSLQVILEDNGIGFSDDLKNGNGLVNMKDRAEVIGGQLDVNSIKGKGTKIQFSGNIA